MKTVGRLVARKTSRITDRTVVTHLARIVLAALAPVLVLAVTACASESEPAAPAAPEPAAAAAPAQKAAPGSGEAAMAPMAPAPAPTARAAAQDSSQPVQVAAAPATKTILERDAPVREAYEQQSSSQPTAKAAQAAPAPTAAPQTSGGQLTASDVQKAVNAAASAARRAPPQAQSGPVAKQAAAAGGPISRPAPVTPPSATTFRDYERSRFASTSEDSVSTFSLDTDRTSFQLALNWARSGHAVDPDSVRAEEWINAFDYGYEPPAHRDSFAITTDVFTHPLDSRMHLVRLGFQAPELQDDAPLNVTLVLDASGSMSNGNRVAIAREAAESIRRSLRSRDRIGVVHFTTDVIEHLTVEHAGPDDRAVRRSIDRLTPHNSTNVQAGLDLGVKLADRVRRERPDAYNYIILMSDGVANVDATDPFAILESAYDATAGTRSG